MRSVEHIPLKGWALARRIALIAIGEVLATLILAWLASLWLHWMFLKG